MLLMLIVGCKLRGLLLQFMVKCESVKNISITVQAILARMIGIKLHRKVNFGHLLLVLLDLVHPLIYGYH